MEGTAAHAPVLSYVAQIAADREFMLVDIGCAGGIDEIWRRFGRRLRAVAVDPNLAEIRRLESLETNPEIRYVAAFAGLPVDHPFARRKEGREDWGRIPWDRLSVARSRALLKTRDLSHAEKIAADLWQEMQLADAAKVIVVPEYLRAHAVASVDFLKIDVDGKDFDVLNSFDDALDEFDVLALALEVNFHGTDRDTDHTLHNTDRFMKASGFELFNITVRRYSLAALPSRYLYDIPAETEFGRLLQGDALYVRDLGSPEYAQFAERLSGAKLLNLICIFAAFNLPDCAAEVALRYRGKLRELCDVDRVLDLLAAQAQDSVDVPLSYREYQARFEAQDPMFFPARSAAPGRGAGPGFAEVSARAARIRALIPPRVRVGLRRLKRAWKVFREPSC